MARPNFPDRRIDGLFAGTRASSSDLLRVVRENPGVLLDANRRDFRAFRVAATSPLGAKRGTGRGGFIDSVLAAVDGFYGAVVQQVRPWAPKAPQLPKTGRTAAEEAGLDLSPPPRDLLEDDIDVVREDVAPGGGLKGESEPHRLDVADSAIDQDDGETIRWDAAEERIDRERGLADSARPDSPSRTGSRTNR